MGEYRVAGHELESPLINAAGSINGTNPDALRHEVRKLAKTGIGAITVGSFTIPRQDGNEVTYGSPVYYHNEHTGETFNSMGLPNIGLREAITVSETLVREAHDNGKTIIFSGSPTNAPEHGSSIQQAATIAYGLLSTGADLVELNVSCPNVVADDGGRKLILGYDVEAMHELVATLHDHVGETERLGIKLPPYLTHEDKSLVSQIARIIHSKGIFRFIVTCNTIPNQIARNGRGQPVLSVPEGKGGLSGPATRDNGRDQLAIWREHSDMDIISTLGVDTGKELAIRRHMGAAAAAGVTFLWQNRNWGDAITKMLIDFASQE